MTVDKYTLRCHIVDAIPQSICHWLIEFKGLSMSTSNVAEWVACIEQRESELLEKEAYNSNTTTKLYASSAIHQTHAQGTTVPNKDAPRTQRPSQSVEGLKPVGPSIVLGPRVPTEQTKSATPVGTQKGPLTWLERVPPNP